MKPLPPSFWVVYRLSLEASRGWPPAFGTSQEEGKAGIPVRAVVRQTDAGILLDELDKTARRTTPIGYFLDGLVYEDNPVARLIEAAVVAKLPRPNLSVAGDVAGGTSFSSEYFAYHDVFGDEVQAWWQSVAPTITPDMNEKLWDALFPGHRFYGMHRVFLKD